MPNLKDIIASDIETVFFNLDDFAEEHFVEGKKIKIVIDNDELTKMKQGQTLGIGEADLMFFVKKKDLPKKRMPGSLLNIDNREYIVVECIENKDVMQYALRQNRSI